MLINEVVQSNDEEIIAQLELLRDSLATDFINDASNARAYLLRGQLNIGDMFTAKSPLNRTSKGQNKKTQKIFDNILAAAGFKSLRHNSICCNSNMASVIRWSKNQNTDSENNDKTLYIIIPHNGYSFTYSKKLVDIGGSYELYMSLQSFLPSHLDVETPINAKTVKQFVNRWQFKHDNMQDALLSQNEITISGTYPAIAYENKAYVEKVFGWPVLRVSLNYGG